MSADYQYDDIGEYGTSFPADLGYGDDIPAATTIRGLREEKPRILLMGLRRSGKSSIQKVVFHKMSPNETLFLESTTKIVKNEISNSSFVQFQVWDFPGQIDFFDPSFDGEALFGECGALIFVLDAQDEYSDAIQKLHMTLKKAYDVNRDIVFEVFIHKVDGLSDDNRIETQRDIQLKVQDNLCDDDLDDIHPSFHLTSIYDHSIFEAFSKVVQKLIPHMDTLENLLDILISNCGMEKAFLIDVVSKIYVATDSLPVDMQTYELCSDLLDMCSDVQHIYGLRDGEESLGPYDSESSCTVTLRKPSANNMVLFLREASDYLCLVCVMREDNFKKHGVINYNVKQLKAALREVFGKTAYGRRK